MNHPLIGPKTDLALMLVIIIVAVIYLRTMLPGMGYSGDVAKFQFIGKVLGVPHPPGYPLYVLLNRLFITLPIGSIAFRANLMSLFFGLLTVVFLYFILRRLGVVSYLAAGTSLTFALTYTFWSQSLIAEVYTLNSFFLAVIIFLSLKWQQTGRRVYFQWSVLLFGLSLAHHLTMLFLAPALLYLLLKLVPRELFNPKTWRLALISLMLALIPYSFLFIRTYQRAPYLESPVRNLADFYNVITAKYFQADLFAFGWRELITKRIPWFFDRIEEEWTWPLLLIMIIGLGWMNRSHRILSFFLIIFILGQSIFIINYHIHDIFVFFIPVYFCLAIFLGAGWQSLVSKPKTLTPIPRFTVLRLLPLAIFFLCSAFPLYLGYKNFPRADFKKLTFYDEQFNVLFTSLDPMKPAIILTDNYLETQFVYNKRFIDFPQHFVLHVGYEPDREVLPQIKTRLDYEILTNRRLQCYLFPDCERLSPEAMLKRFWSPKMLPMRQELLSSIYFNSTYVRLKLFKEGVKTVKLVGQEKKTGRIHFYYRAFLPAKF